MIVSFNHSQACFNPCLVASINTSQVSLTILTPVNQVTTSHNGKSVFTLFTNLQASGLLFLNCSNFAHQDCMSFHNCCHTSLFANFSIFSFVKSSIPCGAMVFNEDTSTSQVTSTQAQNIFNQVHIILSKTVQPDSSIC
jgi:hypothetical protein